MNELKAPYIGYIPYYVPLNKVCAGLKHICPNCRDYNRPITGKKCDCNDHDNWKPHKPLLDYQS